MEEMDFVVVFAPLAGVRGFSQRFARRKIVCVSDALDEREAQFVGAHELGHIMLHGDLNRVFLDTRTFFPTSRYEREADRFAVDLIFDDDDLMDYLDFSLPDVAAALGVSLELAEYRMSGIKTV